MREERTDTMRQRESYLQIYFSSKEKKASAILKNVTVPVIFMAPC